MLTDKFQHISDSLFLGRWNAKCVCGTWCLSMFSLSTHTHTHLAQPSNRQKWDFIKSNVNDVIRNFTLTMFCFITRRKTPKSIFPETGSIFWISSFCAGSPRTRRQTCGTHTTHHVVLRNCYTVGWQYVLIEKNYLKKKMNRPISLWCQWSLYREGQRGRKLSSCPSFASRSAGPGFFLGPPSASGRQRQQLCEN